MKNETYCWLVLLGIFSFPSNSLAKATWWWMLFYRTLRKVPGTTKVRLWEKHVSRDFKMCCCCCRFWCGAPSTDERINAPVLHDASQIDYCRYWGRTSLPPITSNHIVGLVHKNHIIRTCLMYHAACKVEFQPFTRWYSQLTFFNFLPV